VARPNRYVARVRPIGGGAAFEVHVPNPGRMEELLVPGTTTGWIVGAGHPGRRTAYDLVAVRHGAVRVSVDSRIAPRLVRAALSLGALPGIPEGDWRAEVPFGRHRIDFGIRGEDGPFRALLEIKSSNLKVGRIALFPDAPTERGRRHLEALARASREGIDAHVLFAIQRPDVDAIGPNRALDPAFADAFDRARAAGVRCHGIRLSVRPEGVELDRPVPVRPHPFGPGGGAASAPAGPKRASG